MFKSNITSNNIQNKYILPKAYYEKIVYLLPIKVFSTKIEI